MKLSFVFHVDSVPMTKAVIAGEASLGGSESACLGLARALKARGHDVHIATTKLAEDADSLDAWGVAWHHTRDLWNLLPIIDPDVFVALRSPNVFSLPVAARYRILWNQDMLVGEGAKLGTMAYAWAYDELAYVSHYHRKQWEGVASELASLGWVTRNGYDPAHVPQSATKHPNRIIHISRPERGLSPLLAMWPELKRRVPDAELHICRYQSMYDGEGSNVKAMCERYDQMVAQVNGMVGGVEYLGSLGKADLYQAIAESALMWYPGVVDFAETSCIAAIETQACGTPLVCSYKGALPETAPGAVFIHGDAMTPEYQRASIDAVCRLLAGARGEAPFASTYQGMVKDGLEWVKPYTYDAIAEEWESHLWERFDARAKDKARIVGALLEEDDHVAAKALTDDPAIIELCDRVIRGETLTSEGYAKFALDPEHEIAQNYGRMGAVIKAFEGCKNILDLACGNGAFAIALVEADPKRTVLGLDYAAGNIEVARKAAMRRKCNDRTGFECQAICDQATGEITLPEGVSYSGHDGVFLGEFCEHIAGVQTLLRGVRELVGDGVRVVITVPSGPFGDLRDPDTPAQKGHVHHYRPRDLDAIFGKQQDCAIDFLDCGSTMCGDRIGHWVIRYTTSATPFGERPLAHWHRTMRPQQRLSVGILANNCTPDLARCLNDVWWIADEIVLADCGSNDSIELKRLVDRYGVKGFSLPPVKALEGGFSEARNYTLRQSSGEWFMWIDADEQLINGVEVWKYLQSGPYRGYALRQNHLMLDAAQHFDTPVRIFKNEPDIEFYGCVHEQPQAGDCNGDILPALQLNDVQLAHTGYMNEGVRRNKATRRNLPLLVRDREQFPDRRLGLVLVLRDLVNQGMWRHEKIGHIDDGVQDLYARAVTLFEQHFMDPADKFHPIARPFYEQALRHYQGALEVMYALGGKQNGLRGSTPKPLTWWVRKREDLWPLVEHEQQKVKQRDQPLVLDVEPIEQPAAVVA